METVMGAHGSAIFVGDALGLDFLNSIATPAGATIDWIDDGEGLLNSLEQAQLAPADALTTIRAQALPGELDKIADQARSLREWFRGFLRKHQGRPLALGNLSDLEPLNRLLERDEAYSRIVLRHETNPASLTVQAMRPGGVRRRRFSFRSERRWRGLSAPKIFRM
jgi:hypothetical protein